ncbi:MAG: glycoside hydrolase family 2 TIM barrel-domain containing protein [Armatimonadota bacterium]|nr:hypothetical protein [bacterium]
MKYVIALIFALAVTVQGDVFAGTKLVPIDLAPYCTHSFSDDKRGDKAGGWTDQGSANDLSIFPVGPQTFNGIPFNIVDPVKNNGKSCIILNMDGYAPKSVNGIHIGMADVKRIHFLHTSAYNPNVGDSGKYVINYRYSGDEYKRRRAQVNMGYAPESSLTHPLDVPLISPVNIADWWYSTEAPLRQAKVAWSGYNGNGQVSVLDFTWDNPDPTAYIESVDFCSSNTNTVVPILIAVTLEVNDSPFLPSDAQKTKYYEASKLAEDSKTALNDYAESVRKQAEIVLTESLKSSLNSLADEVAASAGKQFDKQFKNIDSQLSSLRNRAETSKKIDFAPVLASAQAAKKSVSDYLKSKDAENSRLYVNEAKSNKLDALRVIAQTKQTLKGKTGYWARTSAIYLDAAQTYANTPGKTSYKGYLNSKNALSWAELAKKRAESALRSDTVVSAGPASVAPVAAQSLPADAVRAKVCLNGRWSISKNGAGDKYPADGWQDIRVPHTTWTNGNDWGSEFTDVSRYNGIKWNKDQHFAWYNTTFEVPITKNRQRVELEFKKIWHYAEVFVNGKYCGNHLGGWSRFFIDITSAVKPGAQNTLAVYVEDDKLTARGDGTNFLGGNCNASKQEGGIYDDVFMHILPSVAISDPFVQTSYRNKQIHVSWQLKSAAKAPGEYTVSATIVGDNKFSMNLGEKAVKNVSGEVAFTRKWQNPVLWGPSQPWGNPGAMYRAIIKVKDAHGKLVDCVEVPFGFREFYAQGEKLYLNGKEIFLQGDHIDVVTNGGFTFRNPEFAVHYMNVARGANIDIVRTHCLESPDWWWDIADQLGMMFEMHNHTLNGYLTAVPDRNWDDPVLKKYVSRDFAESTREYRNHPSIVMWAATNEILSDKQVGWQDMLNFWHGMDKLIKGLDPTRLIHHQGSQGLTGYKHFPFDVACVHYGQDGDAKMHSNLYPGVPTVFGEFMDLDIMRKAFAATDQASLDEALASTKQYLDEKIGVCRANGIAGVLPYQVIQWVALQALENRNRPEGFYKIQWPSESGVGVKTDIADGGMFNWHRNDVPLVYKNSLYYSFRDIYGKRDPLKQVWPIQVIVEGAQPGQIVYARSAILSSIAQGVKADSAGKALFLFEDAGSYTFTAGNQSITAEFVPAPYKELGGFSHIPIIKLGQ